MVKIKQDGRLHTLEGSTPNNVYYVEDVSGVSKVLSREEFDLLRNNGEIEVWKK